MNNTAHQVVEHYKEAIIARNARRFSCDCPIYQSLQEDVDYWYNQVCKQERIGNVTIDEVKQAIGR